MRRKVKNLLEKSRDSALLAVEIYNKPRTAFRSHGFIILLNVAWLSFFHAVFERDKKPYFYKQENGRRYITIDGDRKTFELDKCIQLYFDNPNSAIAKNIEFINKLRDKIEHRFAPEIDPQIFAECQASLMNFEKLLAKEFGEEYCLNENLVFSLQFSRTLTPEQRQAVSSRQSKDYLELREFVDNFRNDLSGDVYDSHDYAFRVYLLPKIGNHQSSSDVSIEFIKDSEQAKEIEKFIIGVKEKKVFFDGMRPGEVAKKVYHALKDKMPPDWKFGPSNHVTCWKHYKVRPETNSLEPEKTDPKYCHFSSAYKSYLYTDEWASFLVDNLSDDDQYKKIFH